MRTRRRHSLVTFAVGDAAADLLMATGVHAEGQETVHRSVQDLQGLSHRDKVFFSQSLG